MKAILRLWHVRGLGVACGLALAGAIAIFAAATHAQENKAADPKGNYTQYVQEKLDEARARFNEIDVVRQTHRSDFESARTEAAAARERASGARRALIAAQGELTATLASLKVEQRSHQELMRAMDATRQAAAAEQAAAQRATAPLVEDQRYKALMLELDVAQTALKQAIANNDSASLETISAEIVRIETQLTELRKPLLEADAAYQAAAKRTEQANAALADVRRRVGDSSVSNPKLVAAYENIDQAQKAVHEAEKAQQAAEARMTAADAGFRSLAGRTSVLEREVKILEVRLENSKKKKK